MENPNEYDDDEFTRWSVEADTAIVSLWEAGASLKDIESILDNAFKNAGAEDVAVSLT